MEQTPLLRGYSTASLAFLDQDFQVYELISLIRTDIMVCPPGSDLNYSLNGVRLIKSTIGI